MKNAKVIAMTNQKGGVAKTTTANALGIGLARKGKKVLLVDLDPQGSLSMSLGISFPDEEENTIAEIFQAIVQKENPNIDECIRHSEYNVDFLIGNTNLEFLEKFLVGYRDGEYFVETMLENLKSEYDYIIIDCRPTLGKLTENAIIAADQILIPCETEFYSIKGMQLLFGEIEEIAKRKNAKLKICGILPTKVNIQTNVSKTFLETLHSVFGEQLHIFSYIPQSVRIKESSTGLNMFELDKNGKAVLAYAKFVDEFLEEQEKLTV